MSANIPSTMPMSDLLKSTGYNCPEELQGKTFDEATSGGDAKISTNTAATVDVSQYTEPVEITPAEGYDATTKVTLTLSNIPSGGGATAYAWKGLDGANPFVVYFDFSIAPETQQEYWNKHILVNNNGVLSVLTISEVEPPYERVSDTSFNDGDFLYTRDTTKDFTLWS
jgi:hypothetical protein